MSSKFKLPTETVELPSKGLLYPEDSPLSKGTVEMKYMTAKEEDILTNQNFIQQGTVIDKLLESMIVTEFTKEFGYEDLLIGDKNAIMVAARVLSYGKDYKMFVRGEEVVVDLSTLLNKEINEKNYEKGKNEFKFILPETENEVTFKLLTHKIERDIDKEIAGLKKIDKNSSTEVTTRLKHMITSINGNTSQADIREFVDNYLLAKDARSLRQYYNEINPDINLTFKHDTAGVEEDVDVSFGLTFFWPGSGV